MAKANHKYRATIYLGKDIYQALEQMADILNISVSSLAKVIFATGWEISKHLDSELGGLTDGK